MSGKLAPKLWVSSLVRRADQAGEFAAVLKKGDETAGQVLLLARRRSGMMQVFTRTLNESGDYSWTVAVEVDEENITKVNEYVERQMRFDPDLWVVELNTENPERFVDDELI